MADRAEHTPGPWRYGPNLAQPVGVYWIQASDGEDITDAVQGEENAKVMTEAPNLLAAAKAELNAGQGICYAECEEGRPCATCQLRAAIKAAS
jgi:hypothetical protein